MGELPIHVKVMKNSPILFTWFNKETGRVEGCLITCPCQKLGLTEKPVQSSKSAKRSAVEPTLLGQALQKATILTTPVGSEIGSVLIPVKKIISGGASSCGTSQKAAGNQICPKGSGKIKFTTCSELRKSNSYQPSETLTVRLIEDINGTGKDDFQTKADNEGSLTAEMNFQSSKNFTGLLTGKDITEEERISQQGAIGKGTLMSVMTSQSVETDFGQTTENGNVGMRDYLTRETEIDNSIMEDENDQLDKSDQFKLNREKSFGTCADSRYEEKNVLFDTGDICTTSATVVQLHQGEHTKSSWNLQVTNKKETGSDTGNIILPSVESQKEDIIIPTSHTDPGDSMSEIERTLCDALKDFINPCPNDVKQHSANINSNSFSETIVDSLSNRNMSTAMLKYRQYENEKFLKKLHKLEEQKVVHAVICEVCGALLTNKRLKSHMAAFHSLEERERKFECSSCHKKFLKAANLERHKLSHTDYMSKCRFCAKSFKYDYYRKAHEKNHLDNPPPAPVRKPRQQNRKLKKTISLGSKKLPLVKSSVARSGRSKENFNFGDSQEVLRIFTCDICGKSVRFVSKYQHLKTHKEKEHPCTICDFRSRTRGALKMHMKKHTNECNIPCRICGKLFKRYQERLNHERIHTGEKPFICHICSKRWRDRATYQGHMKKHHPGMPLMYLRPPIQTSHGKVTSTERAQVSEEV